MKLRIRLTRWLYRDRIAVLQRTIRELMPAALAGDEFAINTVARLSNKLRREYHN